MKRQLTLLSCCLVALFLGNAAAYASTPRSSDGVPGLEHVERLSAPSLSAALDVDSLEPRDDAPRFALGEVSLLGEQRSERFHLAGDELRPQPLTVFEPSYPETRVWAFGFLGTPLVGVSNGVSHELQRGCGDSWLGTPEGIGNWLSEDPAGDVDSPNRYAYVGWRPNEATDPTGHFAIAAPLLAAGVSGVVSVGIGAVASCVFNDCDYSWKDAGIDFGIGAATFGIGSGTGSIARTGARWAARVGAEAVLSAGSEVARREWKGERYTASQIALGAGLNLALGEGGSYVGRRLSPLFAPLRNYELHFSGGVNSAPLPFGGISIRRRPEVSTPIEVSFERTIGISSGAYREAEFAETEGLLYALRDMETDELLKVGKTEIPTLVGRFEKYQTAGAFNTRVLAADIYSVQGLSGRSLLGAESALRGHFEQMGHLLPWDNTLNRLGRVGPGVPGTRMPRRLRGQGYRWLADLLVQLRR